MSSNEPALGEKPQNWGERLNRKLEEDRSRFETWHNEFYGPQDKFNPIRSLDLHPEETGLGYEDPTVQAQFCAFQGALAAAAALKEQQAEPVGYATWNTGTNPGTRLMRHDGLIAVSPNKTDFYHEPVYLKPPEQPAVKLGWAEIVAMVNDVLGCQAHEYPRTHGSIGHEMTGMNFNSLARIIDRIQKRAPVLLTLAHWRVAVSGEWFYGSKERCVKERTEYESTFTKEDFDEAGVVVPEALYTAKFQPNSLKTGVNHES